MIFFIPACIKPDLFAVMLLLLADPGSDSGQRSGCSGGSRGGQEWTAVRDERSLDSTLHPTFAASQV